MASRSANHVGSTRGSHDRWVPYAARPTAAGTQIQPGVGIRRRCSATTTTAQPRPTSPPSSAGTPSASAGAVGIVVGTTGYDGRWRRAGNRAATTNSSSSPPAIRRTRAYCSPGVKTSSTRPAAPAGTNHACFHPSRRVGSSRTPSRVARQPGLAFSGTTR